MADILSEGYSKQEILKEFRNRKNALTSAFKSIAEDTVANSKPMTKEELAAELAYEILPSKHVIKYLKKLKEKTLKEQFLR